MSRDSTLFIPLHEGIVDHPKFCRLKRRLKKPDAQLLGHLGYLWLKTLRHDPKGWDADDVAEAARWRGKAQVLLDALLEAEWLERDVEGNLQVHDWASYVGAYLEKRERAAAKKREQRLAKDATKDVPGTSSGRPSDVPSLSESESESGTESEEEKREESAPASPAVAATSEGHPGPVPILSPGQAEDTKAKVAAARRARASRMSGGIHALNAALLGPKSLDEALGFVTGEGLTLEAELERDFPAYDGKSGRPPLRLVLTLWWENYMSKPELERPAWPTTAQMRLRKDWLFRDYGPVEMSYFAEQKRNAQTAANPAAWLRPGSPEAMVANEAAKAAAAPDVEAKRAARAQRDAWEMHRNDCRARNVEWPYVDEHAWRAAGSPPPDFGDGVDPKAALEALAGVAASLTAKSAPKPKPPRDLAAAAAAVAAARQA